MKLNQNKLFDATVLGDEQLQQKLEPLILWINSQFDGIITALQGNLTLVDNLKCENKVITLTSDTPKRVTLTKNGLVTGVLVTAYPTDRQLLGFSYKLLSQNSLEITASFSESGITTIGICVLFA